MMGCDEMLTVLSMCFAPVGKDEWEQLTARTVWSDFLDAARCALQEGAAFGEPASPIELARARCPLQDFLSAGEVKALFAPPTYDEKRRFAARHFTGGLPQSAMPVESLYTSWSNGPLPTPFSKAEGMYQGDSARYLRDLVERMGMQVPPEFAACPDHLALELDLTAVMLRSGMREAAVRFMLERFSWLTEYRMRLLELDDDARFYIGLVDVVLGARARLAPAPEAGERPIEANARAERNRSHACI